jgi:hypothetical protein
MTVNIVVNYECDDGTSFQCAYVVRFAIGLDCNAQAPGAILSGGCVEV